MNERIQELYMQAIQYADSVVPAERRYNDIYYAIASAKHAELIVEECMWKIKRLLIMTGVWTKQCLLLCLISQNISELKNEGNHIINRVCYSIHSYLRTRLSAGRFYLCRRECCWSIRFITVLATLLVCAGVEIGVEL